MTISVRLMSWQYLAYPAGWGASTSSLTRCVIALCRSRLVSSMTTWARCARTSTSFRLSTLHASVAPTEHRRRHSHSRTARASSRTGQCLRASGKAATLNSATGTKTTARSMPLKIRLSTYATTFLVRATTVKVTTAVCCSSQTFKEDANAQVQASNVPAFASF
jgi:hypothetical protein